MFHFFVTDTPERGPMWPAPSSTEAEDGMRRIWFFERSNLVVSQADGKSRCSLWQMIRFGGSNNGGSDSRLAEKPGQCNLGARNTTLCCNFTQAFHNLAIGLFRSGV